MRIIRSSGPITMTISAVLLRMIESFSRSRAVVSNRRALSMATPARAANFSTKS